MGVIIIDSLQRGGSGTAPFPVIKEIDSKLSYLTVADLTARDAIPEWQRLPFMRVHVISTAIDYRLGADTTISGQSWSVVNDSITPGTYQLLSEKNQPGGYVGLESTGKINPAYISNIYSNTSYVVASLTDRNNLSTATGDIVITTDTSQIWVKLNNNPPVTGPSDFSELSFPGSVLSVNGQVGVVDITITNLLAVPANLTDFNTAVAAAPSVLNLNSISAVHTGQIDQLIIDVAALQAASTESGYIPTYELTSTYNINQAVKFQETSGRYNLYVANTSIPVSTSPGGVEWERIGDYYTTSEITNYLVNKADLVLGVVPLSQTPPEALVMSYVVANLTDRNAITPQIQGMRVYVTGNGSAYIYSPATPGADPQGFVLEFDAGAAGVITNANNGLSVSGGTIVQLGGPLIQSTSITGAFKLSFNNSGIGLPNLASDGAFISASNGSIYYNTTSNVFRWFVNGAWADAGADPALFWKTNSTTTLTGNTTITTDVLNQYTLILEVPDDSFAVGYQAITLQGNLGMEIRTSVPGVPTQYSAFQALDGSGRFTYADVTTSPVGLQYAADYSTNFTNRSLADWGNVWRVKGTTTITATSTISVGAQNISFTTLNASRVTGLSISGSVGNIGFSTSYAPLSKVAQVNLAATGGINISQSNLTYASIIDVGSGSDALIIQSGTADLLQTQRINFSTFKIGDFRTTAVGIEYEADYSSNYTNRSLVDKEYVDTASFWPLTGSATLTGATTINNGGFGLDIISPSLSGIYRFGHYSAAGDNGDSYLSVETGFGTSLRLNAGDNRTGSQHRSVIQVQPQNIQILYRNTSDEQKGFNFGNGGFQVFDQQLNRGMEYADDYSANYTNRSLVDRGYVLGAKTFTGQQTFASGATGSLIVGSHTADLSSPVNGMLYYNSTANELRARINGSWVALGGGGGGGGWNLTGTTTLTGNVTIDAAGNQTSFYSEDLGGISAGFSSIVTDPTIFEVYSEFYQGIFSASLSYRNGTGTPATTNETLLQLDGQATLQAKENASTPVVTKFVINPVDSATHTVTVSSDYSGFAGVRYDIDYSANFTARSLVDKGYVDSMVGSGGWAVTGSTSLTGNVTIDGAFNIHIGTDTGARTYTFGGGATLTATTKIINLGTAGVSGSVTNINIGSSVSGATGTTSINSLTFNVTSATSISMGAATGTFTINNPNLVGPASLLAFSGMTLLTLAPTTVRLSQVPANDAGFATSNILVRDSTGDIDKLAASGGGTTNFLRADGTWAAPSGGGSPGGTTNEVQINVGSAFVGAKMFIDPATGNVTLGDTGLAGAARTFTADGSATDVGLTFVTKGAGAINFGVSNTGNINIGTSATGAINIGNNGAANSVVLRGYGGAGVQSSMSSTINYTTTTGLGGMWEFFRFSTGTPTNGIAGDLKLYVHGTTFGMVALRVTNENVTLGYSTLGIYVRNTLGDTLGLAIKGNLAMETEVFGPLKLAGYTTGSLPTASNHARGLVWDTTTNSPKISDGTEWFDANPVEEFNITLDGGGAVLSTGDTKTYKTVGFSGKIIAWYITGDPSGSIVVDVWNNASAIPTNSDSIAGSEKPTLSSQTRNSDTALSTWTQAFTAGSTFGIEIESVTSVTKAILTIKYIKT